jgi:hypothetical protein
MSAFTSGEGMEDTKDSDSSREELDGAMFSIWLHGNWSWLTKNMTTPEKEAAADAVERHGRATREPDEPWETPERLRWWRD